MSRSVLLLVPAALAGLLPFSAPAAPAPNTRKPAVELVLVVDTTGSMGSLLDGMRRSLWAIFDQALDGRPTPELRVGLVAYRDKGDDYVTKVVPLTDDLDAAYLSLHELTAAGGGDTPEHVNQGLYDAVHEINWSKGADVAKLIVLIGDAAPHVDYSDDVKYPVTCAKAIEKGIAVNAIRCGDDTDCAKHFAEIARLGGGAYASVRQNGGVRTVPTPLDKRLAEINAALAKDVLVHGRGAAQRRDAKKVEAASKLATEAAADRAGCLSKLGRVARFDLIDADRAGLVRMDELETDELPASLRDLDAGQRRERLGRAVQRRADLLREAHELDAKRAGYAARNRADRPEGYDEHVVAMVRRQAGRRPKF
jgi:Mg-chelatase subunit ChlD